AAVLRRIEDSTQVLLGFSDVLAHDRRQVDAIEIQSQLVREHLGCHRLACSARAGEEHAEPEPARTAAREAPRLEHPHAVPYMSADVAKHLLLRLRQHEIVPCRSRLDALREAFEAWTSL